MEEIAKLFLQYGVVGAVALVTAWLYFAERKRTEELRERLEAAAKTSAAAERDQAAKYAGLVEVGRLQHEQRIETLATLFAGKLEAMDKVHHEQEDELTDRLIKASETYAEKNGQLTASVTLLVESVKRRSE